jgi:hypothetical protein
MTLAHQMMKTFQREVTQKRLLYGSGAAKKQTVAQTMVATIITSMKVRERRKGIKLRK